jgi:U3 small nucleolar RNA-associated protein 14
LNSEERDKKFVQKYMVKELPPQYQSTKQFETLMSLPVGKEWNTGDSYRRLIQPDLLTKAGSVIKPLRFKSDIKVETIEKLVAHREQKKAQRSTAKF